jgi:D-beta-D-heptose 7-phosphate kinase/D-beta-D-heptose 1-phosphate adenosyltransferase
MKIAIVGDSFTDKYCFGTVDRISPEAPIPILNVTKTELRGGGALNVANNLYSLGIKPTLFTITDVVEMEVPYTVISPLDCIPLVKTRFIGNHYQLLRADEPLRYEESDLKRLQYPKENDFDIIAFIDYNKGIINGGKATIVDSKKKDLSVFWGSEYLKVNDREFTESENAQLFPKVFVTKGEDGIEYHEAGKLIDSSPTLAKEVIDVVGAGDTVMAVMLYCLATGITDPRRMMKLANKGAAAAVSKIGTTVITPKDLK